MAPELLPQGVDGEVEGVVPDVSGAAVHRLQDFPARKRAPLPRDERAEKEELRRRQRERLSVREGGPRRFVDRDAAGAAGVISGGRRVWRGAFHRRVRFADDSSTGAPLPEATLRISNTFLIIFRPPRW